MLSVIDWIHVPIYSNNESCFMHLMNEKRFEWIKHVEFNKMPFELFLFFGAHRNRLSADWMLSISGVVTIASAHSKKKLRIRRTDDSNCRQWGYFRFVRCEQVYFVYSIMNSLETIYREKKIQTHGQMNEWKTSRRLTDYVQCRQTWIYLRLSLDFVRDACGMMFRNTRLGY